MTAADLVGTYPAGSPEWHALRATGIGGSDIAAVLGLSPWESAFSLWHRKAANIADQAETREMSWGRYHEDTIARWYRDTHPGVRVARTGTWRNRERVWQLANPDRVLTGRRVLEIKTDRSGDAWGPAGTDDVPVYYRSQVLWYLDCLGWDVGHLAVLIGGSDARVYTLRWSAEEAQTMRDIAEAFWTSLRAGEAPPLDGHDATYRAVRELHPNIVDLDVEVPERVAHNYVQACEAERGIADLKRRAAAELLDVMGDARRAVHAGRRIAIRVPGRAGKPPSLRPCTTSSTDEGHSA